MLELPQNLRLKLWNYISRVVVDKVEEIMLRSRLYKSGDNVDDE